MLLKLRFEFTKSVSAKNGIIGQKSQQMQELANFTYHLLFNVQFSFVRES